MSARRGGIPGPESRTGLVRPAMSEAEFKRRQGPASSYNDASDDSGEDENETTSGRSSSTGRGGSTRGKAAAKSRRVQRMFAIEEDLDRKLWLYAIHLGKDRSEVVNELLRPVVTSMVLYDSRDRRSSSSSSGNGSRLSSRSSDDDGGERRRGRRRRITEGVFLPGWGRGVPEGA